MNGIPFAVRWILAAAVLAFPAVSLIMGILHHTIRKRVFGVIGLVTVFLALIAMTVLYCCSDHDMTCLFVSWEFHMIFLFPAVAAFPLCAMPVKPPAGTAQPKHPGEEPDGTKPSGSDGCFTEDDIRALQKRLDELEREIKRRRRSPQTAFRDLSAAVRRHTPSRRNLLLILAAALFVWYTILQAQDIRPSYNRDALLEARFLTPVYLIPLEGLVLAFPADRHIVCLCASVFAAVADMVMELLWLTGVNPFYPGTGFVMNVIWLVHTILMAAVLFPEAWHILDPHFIFVEKWVSDPDGFAFGETASSGYPYLDAYRAERRARAEKSAAETPDEEKEAEGCTPISDRS